jgi:hypothetical protein
MHNNSPLPSNRSFGTLFTVVFALLAALAWWKDSAAFGWFAAASGLFAAVTLVSPGWLAPLNRLWMALANVLNKVVSPIVLGILYYGLVTPFGVVRRLLGKDSMHRKFDPATQSYWIERQPPGPPPDSLGNQF